MMRAYSMDLRQRVLADCGKGMATLEVATKYSVSTAWVRRLKQRLRTTGQVEPRKGRPGRKPALAGQHDRLRQAVADQPDLTAREYRDRLGLCCAVVTVWRCLRRLGLTFKKKSSTPASSRAPTSPPAATSGGAR
jgi:transposase